MEKIQLEEHFLDKPLVWIDSGHYSHVAEWLTENWKYCSRCATEMDWARQEPPSYDRTTGRPTCAWIWSCVFFWSAPQFHDAFEDFRPLSPTPPTSSDTSVTSD
jgi:hypothetical protein